MGRTYSAFKRCILLFISAYRWFISPILPKSCRFYPTCSQYAMEAIETFGIGQGLYLAVKRLLRCHPWSLGGFDPVPLPPEKISKKRKQKTGYGVESIFSNYTFNFCFIGLSGLFSRTTKCDGTSRE